MSHQDSKIDAVGMAGGDAGVAGGGAGVAGASHRTTPLAVAGRDLRLWEACESG
jgi:hypothetical protein